MTEACVLSKESWSGLVRPTFVQPRVDFNASQRLAVAVKDAPSKTAAWLKRYGADVAAFFGDVLVHRGVIGIGRNREKRITAGWRDETETAVIVCGRVVLKLLRRFSVELPCCFGRRASQERLDV